jgi:dihydroorotase
LKNNPILAPSGPLVQHAVVAMFESFHQGKISIEGGKICHNPAKIFKIEKRGFIKEAITDLVIVNSGLPWRCKKEYITKYGWSHLKGLLSNQNYTTTLNGQLVYNAFKSKKYTSEKTLV